MLYLWCVQVSVNKKRKLDQYTSQCSTSLLDFIQHRKHKLRPVPTSTKTAAKVCACFIDVAFHSIPYYLLIIFIKFAGKRELCGGGCSSGLCYVYTGRFRGVSVSARLRVAAPHGRQHTTAGRGVHTGDRACTRPSLSHQAQRIATAFQYRIPRRALRGSGL